MSSTEAIEPDAADDQPRAIRLEDVATHVEIALAHRRHDRAQRDRVLTKAVGVHVDLVLLDVAAHGRDFGHAWHGIELVTDEPVLQAAEIAK